jgi:MFS family permease
MSGIAPLGALSGPWLGGELVQHAGWRAIFYAAVPVAAVIVALGWNQLPAGEPLRLPERAWLGEAVLLGGAAAAVVLALTLAAGGKPGWLALGLAAAPLAWAWSRTRTSRPVLALLRMPGVGGPHLALVLGYTALMTVQFLAPFYLARVAGSPSAAIGTALLGYPAAAVAAGPLAGLAADKTGGRLVATAGAAVLTAGVALMVPLSPGWGLGGLAWRLAVVGLGFASFTTPLQSMAMSRVPESLRGTTGASTSLARQLGMAFGPALGSAAWAASGYSVAGIRASLALAAVLSAALIAVLARRPVTPPTEGVRSNVQQQHPEGGRHLLLGDRQRALARQGRGRGRGEGRS